MAKKNQKEQGGAPKKGGISKAESFTHGMVSDLDPHFQLKGSYSDAKNIRLTNSEGDTFTVENIEGNSLFVDLATTHIDTPKDQFQQASSYPTFHDRGGHSTDMTQNLDLRNRASIVGHVSYANQLLLMIVARFEWDRGHLGDGAYNTVSSNLDPGDAQYTSENTEIDRTIFLLVNFDHELKVTKVTDLRVCYNAGDPANHQYPDLGMDLDMPVRIEHIVENDKISRIYWTDNKNPLRTLNIKESRLDLIEPTSLDITPLMKPSQPVLSMTLFGSLPVGVFQYCFKYISENGGESTFSPLSNMYHVSDQSFSNSTQYAGGPQGNVGTQGFQIHVHDLDDSFTHIELYSLFYDTVDSAPRVAVVGRNVISGSSSFFQHTSWNNEVENGLEEILIESNTFDVCKDIAIKDNILFAANLRQKRNYISEKEWNVKVLRYRIATGNTTDRLDAMLTTNDPEVKHYQLDAGGAPVEINSGLYEYNVVDEYGYSCGYGQLLGDPNGMYSAAPGATWEYMSYDGNLNVPMWTTALANQRNKDGGSGPGYPIFFTYKFLADKMTPGAESFNYASNGLGGCRVSFGLEEKIADTSQNAFASPYISSVSNNKTLQTDFEAKSGTAPTPTGNTIFKTSMALGGSKDPHLSGDKKGYQRGDIYRFGVQIYDLNGAPGNVLWIGDIETPHQHDVNRMINIKDKAGVGSGGYTPFRPTASGVVSPDGAISLQDAEQIISHEKIKDFRLSFIYGHAVPPVDVEWFSARLTINNYSNPSAYVNSDGSIRANEPGDTTNPRNHSGGQARGVPAWSEDTGGPKDLLGHDDTHHLFDLCVNFEFIIPDSVCKKISGFRVVRAQRSEEDRRIVQQGLLNQTVQYGHAKHGSDFGYGSAYFSQEDNQMFGDDPVFVNQYIDSPSGIDNTHPEQPEYNTYLNGYLGLAEISQICFYNSNVTVGKACSGGLLDGKAFYWPEMEDSKEHQPNSPNDQGPYHARERGDNANRHGGPGTYGEHFRHSGYFGGFDKMAVFNTGTSNESTSHQSLDHVSGSIFTLDSPDSAFGIRPYVYREGDFLRIDDILKLTDEIRYKNTLNTDPNGIGILGMPLSHHSNCRNITGKRHDTGNTAGEWAGGANWDQNLQQEEWKPNNSSSTLKEAITFCTRKDIDEDYAILIAKYYSFDPYYGIGFEIDGGVFAAKNKAGDTNSVPKKNYGWSLPIANSKELSDGEVVPSGFFTVSPRMKEGRVHGFSNNTLGYANIGRKSYGDRHLVWGAINSQVPANRDAGPVSGNGNQGTPKQEDFTYDSVSTMQMGLRSILIEVDNRASVVKLKSPTDTFFETGRTERRYTSWFAPINVSALYEHGDYVADDKNGGNNNPNYNEWNELPYRSAFLRQHLYAGTQALPTKDSMTVKQAATYVPHKLLCSIVRNIVPYGGYTKGSIEKTRYMPCGNFHPVNEHGDKQGHVSQVFGGDTFVNLYSHQKTSTPYMKKSAARWQIFPVESHVNTDMRSGLTLNAGDTVLGRDINTAPFSNDWLYNSVYSQENNIKSGVVIDEDTFTESLDLPYEIAYSNTKILGQKTDAFRQFPINQFHDMEGSYGEINRIVNFKNEIYVLQDTAFAKLLVNPISMLSDDSGTSLFTGTGETVENHIYISTKFGSRHRFSVAMSEKSLYFVDSNFGRLFKYDTEKLISLGDALGQRNYLQYVIKEWEARSYRVCTDHFVAHQNIPGWLDNTAKIVGNERNYVADRPLDFLGITSIYDFKNKELLVTFHNAAWSSTEHKRQRFSRAVDMHSVSSTVDGEPIGISETLVYSEAINAFTSKYSVAPPQWLYGSQGSFILCPENEINVNSLANFKAISGKSGSYTHLPYDYYGSNDSNFYKNRRCNPLRLWTWDYHKEQKKTHFFGKKDDHIGTDTKVVSPIDGNEYSGKVVLTDGTIELPDESYIEKIINSEGSASKVFDNVQSVMTPDHVDFSFIDYTTDVTHDTITARNVLDKKTELVDETEQLVINRRWNFDATYGWHMTGTGSDLTINGDGTIGLIFDGDSSFKSPNKIDLINLPGKYNNIIRMKLKRTNFAGTWEGKVYWKGYDPVRKLKGDYLALNEIGTRTQTIAEPQDIDNDFVIVEWDMSGIGDADGSWDDCIIQRIRIDLAGNAGIQEFDVEWIEIGGLKADKYIDGILKAPLRTEKSTKRTRGTYAKIKYTAKTTEKFNIFAILAKYRKTY